MEMLIIVCIAIIVLVLFIKAPKLDDGGNKQNAVGKERKTRVVYRENYALDGFYNPRKYPPALTDHARQRMHERLHINSDAMMEKYLQDAYTYGKSARQLSRNAAYQVRRIEEKEDKIVLLYKNYVYIFSEENVLITVYENENIKI